MADPRTLPRPLSSAGAIVADSGPSLGLPLHYGWLADEQERFERGLGFTYLGEIGVVIELHHVPAVQAGGARALLGPFLYSEQTP